ncbi:MAG: MFS transporter [archaeon]|nr:MFS transporter [archaeon]
MLKEDSEKFTNNTKKKTAKYFIFLLIFLGCMEMIDTYVTVFPTMIPSSVTVYFGNISDGDYSALVGIASLGTLVAVIIQFMADIFGRRIFLAVSLIGMGIGSIFMFFSDSIEMFIFSLFLLYIFYGADIYTIYVAEEAPKEKRSMYTNYVMVFGTLGAIVTFVLRLLFITEESDVGNWRILTVFGFLAIPLSLFVLKIKETTAFEEFKEKRESPDYEKESFITNFIQPFSTGNRKGFIALLLVSFLIGFNQSMAYIGELLMDKRFTKDEVSIGLAIAIGIMTLGFVVTGWGSDKYGRKRMFYVHSALFPVGVAIMAFGINSSDYYMAYALCLLGISIGITLPQCLIIQTRILCVETLRTDLRGIGTAWRSIVAAWGVSLGLILNGILTDALESIGISYAIGYSFAIISFTFLINIPIVYFLMKETKGIDVKEI